MFYRGTILLVLLGLSGCASSRAYDPATSTRFPSNEAEHDALAEHLRRHPARQAAYWAGFLSRPYEERFQTITPEVLDYIRKDNLKWGFTEVPAPAKSDPAFEADLRAAMEGMPEAVQELTRDRLAAVFVVEDLGGSAYQESIHGADGTPVAGFIVLNKKVLDQPANAWGTWKENDPFQPEEGVEIRQIIEAPEGNTRQNAMRFILLHELGHVVANFTTPAPHPPPAMAAEDVTDMDTYPYASPSWEVVDGAFRSRFDDAHSWRPKVKFYFGPDTKQPAGSAAAIYADLTQTNFPSLYGATSPADDFAEGFATYIHTVLEGRPYRVEVHLNGTLAQTFQTCWGTERCAAKEAALRAYLATDPKP